MDVQGAKGAFDLPRKPDHDEEEAHLLQRRDCQVEDQADSRKTKHSKQPDTGREAQLYRSQCKRFATSLLRQLGIAQLHRRASVATALALQDFVFHSKIWAVPCR